MKTLFQFTIFSIILISCHPTQEVIKASLEDQCTSYHPNNIGYIEVIPMPRMSNGKVDTIHEVRFQCVNYAYYTGKAMYDLFGRWDKMIKIPNSFGHLLKWTNIDLLNNGIRYTVYASGVEDRQGCYSAVVVYDQNKTNVLSKRSPVRDRIIQSFSDWIKEDDSRNIKFIKEYRKARTNE